ncbi:MAG TPA: pyruvate dehydrogenase (acetyl-transferring) E1 component subunit alpha [Arenicellales bacterium]|nr:pyruvate dehydrogenase (acetyl-transferring) E1 component subunit alpha [Arenicellales bacterium]
MEVVASFEIRYRQCLDAHGEPVGELPAFADDPDALRAMYRSMVLTRIFDQRAVALQRTGQLGTYASSLGQEASFAGIGHAMQPDDLLVPSYREHGACFVRGVRPTDILLYWGGDERGMDFEQPRQDFPVSVPIATHLLHAAGAAYAFKYRGEARAALAVSGDGSTSKGDFYEAINVAGVWQLPCVFVVVNNQWAISVPRSRQSHAETLAQKAVAAGIPGEQVDGNDVIVVRDRVEAALRRAREGGGPTLIEALTYRLHDHTTADDASRYRSEEEVEAARRKDPVERLRRFMSARGAWDEQQEEQLQKDCSSEVDAAVDEYLNTGPRPPETMFDNLYETLPSAYQAQRDELKASGRRDE